MTHKYSPTLSLSPKHTLFFSQSLTQTLSLPLSFSLSHSQTLTHILSHTLTLLLTHSHTHSLSLPLIPHSLSCKSTNTFYLILSPSLPRTQTPSVALSLCLAHSHTLFYNIHTCRLYLSVDNALSHIQRQIFTLSLSLLSYSLLPSPGIHTFSLSLSSSRSH
jgi:hypothetical protein